jgi:hypothetical protein
MPNVSAFLKLILPLFGEFQDSWDQVLDQNFESLDDHLADLRRALLTGTQAQRASADYSALVGSLYNLASRLNVSINPDGTLNLQNSPTIAALGSSATNGDDYLGTGSPNNSPRLRFDFSDLEIWNARSPLSAARFNPAATVRGLLDDGLAVRARDGGAMDASRPISSPDRSFVSGLVQGPENFLSGVSPNQVKFDASPGVPSSWPAFNIDGYVFRIRQGIVLDLSTDISGTALNPGDIVYLYVSRVDYKNTNCRSKLATDPGAPQQRDLRRLQAGSDGVISGKTLSSASANFQGSATQWTVLPGDILVIDSGAAAGSYVIGSVPSPNTVTIVGAFKADGLSGQAWHIQDDAHPNVGCVKVADATTDPPFVPGRVYVGRGQLNFSSFQAVGGAPFSKVAFPLSGVFDSGWQNVTVSSFPMVFEHNLGMLPSHVEVWVRDSLTGEAFQPFSLRSFVVDFDTTSPQVSANSPKKATLRIPSMYWHSTRQRTEVHLSASAPNAAAELFTKDDDTTHVTSGQIRLIARR